MAFRASDPNIDRWIADHRAATTAKAQLEQLELFCRKTGVTPPVIVKLARAKIASPDARGYEDLVRKWIAEERKAGRPDSYVALNYAAIRSWLKFHEALPTWKPSLRVRPGTTVRDERVPSVDELRQLLSVLNARGRVVVLMMASTGVRPGVFGRRDVPEGLRLRDLPELEIGDEPKFSQTPFKVVVRDELSKAGIRYVTFGTEEAADAIVAYLKERISRGEGLTPNTPLITADRRAPRGQSRVDKHGFPFLGEDGLSNDIRAEMQKVAPKGVSRRLYVWRAFFSTQMALAENEGLVTRDMREAWLGHITGVDQRYNFGKRWNEKVEAEMRKAYAAASSYLMTGRSKPGVDPKLLEAILLNAQFSPDEIEKAQPLDTEKVLALIAGRGSGAKAGSVEEVVSADRFKQLLSERVTFEEKMPFGNGEVFVKYRPGASPSVTSLSGVVPKM